MDLSIASSVYINNHSCNKDGKALLSTEEYKKVYSADDFYKCLKYNYMKFFKMDLLCKWAWLGAEVLLSNNSLAKNVNKNNVAVILMTHHGCIDVDKKYLRTTETIPSPALFVYTLPNIMLGEICIRHRFKGEQASLVSSGLNVEELYYYANDLLQNRGMDACLVGWVDAYNDNKEVVMCWVEKGGNGHPFTINNIEEIYSKN